MEDIRRILVISMVTKYSERAISLGVSLAKKYAAELHVVHIISNPFGLKGWEGWVMMIPSLRTLEEEYERIRQEAKLDLVDFYLRIIRKISLLI